MHLKAVVGGMASRLPLLVLQLRAEPGGTARDKVKFRYMVKQTWVRTIACP